MTRRIAAQLARVLAVGVGFVLMSVGTAGQQVGRVPLEVRVPMPPQPVVALGRTHLAYELHLTNFGASSIQLDRLDVISSDGAAVGTWSGTQLRQRATAVGGSAPADPAAPVQLDPGTRAVVFLWVTLTADQVLPAALMHRVTASADQSGPHVVETRPIAVTTSLHATIGGHERQAMATRGTTAPATIDAADAPGNVVVLELGDGRFATYVHLKAGSIVVEEGARVRAGQVIARIGNSGNSGGPHLHFHVSDAVEPLGGEGLPFSIGQFELAGRVAGLGPLLGGAPWAPQANQPARTVTAEMPLENMVVRFGG